LLLDLKRSLIFVAGVKTGSTTVERIYEKQVDIRIVRSEWGKHDSIAEIRQKYNWIFRVTPVEDFFVWGVIREPVDWLSSLYRSHKDPKFASTGNLYTGGMTFSEFYDVWRLKNSGQSAPQINRFLDEKGEFAIDFLVPFERLQEGIQAMAPRYGMTLSEIPHLNKSPVVDDCTSLNETIIGAIHRDYRADYEYYERASRNSSMAVDGWR